ncbi:MAG: fibrobacter succinogenes major paralogous domain-containing protein [Bacteroidota bacterium]
MNLPEVTTIGVKNTGISSVQAFGRLTGLGISSKGFCWDTVNNPSIDKWFSDEGSGSKAFNSDVSGLKSNKKYYLRAYAKNDAGIVYGDVVSFQTLIEPQVTTNTASVLNYSMASIGGSVNASGYPILEVGICFDTQKNPDITKRKTYTSGTTNFNLTITALNEKTVYYYKAYAKFSFGTYYGAERTFTTGAAPIPLVVFTNTGTVSDYDGNVYKTITIGNKTWMAENLHVQTYNDGSTIPSYYSNASAWPNLVTGAYGYYNNNFSYVTNYGFLYNYFTIEDARGLAPAGWHIPTDAEWLSLISLLNNANPSYSFTAIQQLYSTSAWSNLNCSINNYSNMKLMPAGFRSIQGADADMGYSTAYWTMDNSGAYASIMYFDNNCFLMSTSKYKNCGYSIRCVKD